LASNTELIKQLRELTNAGVMDCRNALVECNDDIHKAEELLLQKGIASASKKIGRDTNQGIIETYIHGGGRIGSIIEMNCETDFVARTDEFKNLCHNIAMQVAAMDPKAVSFEINPDSKLTKDDFLVNQSFIKDPSKTIQDLINEYVGKLGENIKIRRFERFSLGE
jgi:elongation factor Ts